MMQNFIFLNTKSYKKKFGKFGGMLGDIILCRKQMRAVKLVHQTTKVVGKQWRRLRLHLGPLRHLVYAKLVKIADVFGLSYSCWYC
jgi:hypothetical protein